jgi:hypothetical protein
MSKSRELQVDITNLADVAGAFSCHPKQSAGILSFVGLFGKKPRKSGIYKLTHM